LDHVADPATDVLARMRWLGRQLRARPRLFLSAGAGTLASLMLTGSPGPVTRALCGWNVGVWMYLVLIVWMMVRADHHRMRRVALAHAEGASTVLMVVIAAAAVSLGAVVVELAAAKAPGARHALPHLLFALATVAGSWLLVPVMFTLGYASVFYRTTGGEGLKFPSDDPAFRPDYGDFLYFSFTLAVASQTADVSVSSPTMRRLVLLQSLVSFVFNTTILAFTINIAASLF
jgi:uncharacterized membrane protein